MFFMEITSQIKSAMVTLLLQLESYLPVILRLFYTFAL